MSTEEQRRTSGGVVEDAREVVSAKASDAAEQGRGMVESQIRQRSSQAGEQVDSMSQTLHRVAEQSRLEGNAQQARWADAAASRADRFSSFLRDTDPEQMLDRAEDVARREPWLVAGIGLLVGLVAARSLKASSGRRYDRRSTTWQGDSQWRERETWQPQSGVGNGGRYGEPEFDRPLATEQTIRMGEQA
jgi:ElaB/YqjD/DUF883 family membrane-anchored ribosome-binding protein